MQTEEQKRKKRNKILKIVGALAGVFLLMSCSAIVGVVFLGSEPTAMPASVTTVIVSATPTEGPRLTKAPWPTFTPTATPIPTMAPPVAATSTPRPTKTPQPTAIPTPRPTLTPIPVPVVFEGSGDVVTDNMQLPACQKSVFSWQHGGTSNFFVDLCGVSCKSLIIAGRDDTTGEAFQPLTGGGYYLVVESVKGPWTVTWECRD